MADEQKATLAVAAVVGGVDSEVQEYLGGILAESIPQSVDEVTALIGEMLIGYEVCCVRLFFGRRHVLLVLPSVTSKPCGPQVASTETEAAGLCAKVFDQLVLQGLCGPGHKAKDSDEPKLLEKPCFLGEGAGQFVNPLESQPSALQLGQNLMRNKEVAEHGDVNTVNTKAKLRRQAKEARAAEALLTWSDDLSEAAAYDALQVYLEVNNQRICFLFFSFFFSFFLVLFFSFSFFFLSFFLRVHLFLFSIKKPCSRVRSVLCAGAQLSAHKRSAC